MPEGEDGKGTAFFVRHGESTSNDRNVFAGACRAAAARVRSPLRLGPVVGGAPGARASPRRPASRAGIHDVYLTEYGKLQARRAGQVRPRLRASRSGAPPCLRAVAAAAIRPPRDRCSTALTRRGTLQDIARRGIKFDAIFVSHMRRARQTCQLVMEECDPECTLPHQIDHRLAEKSFGIFAGRNINVLRMVRGASVARASQPPCGARLLTRPLRRRCTASRRSSG